MNDFVNPQHRGVNLPAGFKDLIDVLKAKKASNAETQIVATGSDRKRPLLERYEMHGLKHTEKFVRLFLDTKSKVVSLAFFPKQNQLPFCLFRSRDFMQATFCLSKEEILLERNVREIFARFGVVPVSDASVVVTKQRVVSYSVPNSVPELLKIMTEVLRGAYEVSGSAGLTFAFHEQ